MEETVVDAPPLVTVTLHNPWSVVRAHAAWTIIEPSASLITRT